MAYEGVAIFDPRLQSVLRLDAALECLCTGAVWSGGPVWVDRTETLVWSDIANNRMLAGLWQALHGLAPGTKGGPTAATLRGDHFDRTLRRVLFERIHESLGWIAVLAAVAAILSEHWVTDTPRWMLAAVVFWWCLPSAASMHWQRAGRAPDTHQAIWGPDPALPGNRRAPVGWGVVRRPRGVAPMRADGRRARGKE